MDTLVALGTLAALRVLRLSGKLLWAVADHSANAGTCTTTLVALIIAFLLLGRFFEARVKGSASGAMRALLELGGLPG